MLISSDRQVLYSEPEGRIRTSADRADLTRYLELDYGFPL